MTGAPHSIVVGGSRGIGQVIAERLLASGSVVSVISRRPPERPGLRHHPADLRDRAAVARAVDGVAADGGPFDHLVFVQRHRGEGDEWAGELDTALTATKDIVEGLCADRPRRPGSIVVVSSLAASLVVEEQPVGYHATKAALDQMVRYYAFCLGPEGIRVNAVTPGAVLKEEARGYYDAHPEVRDAYAEVTPLGRMAEPRDVAGVVGFLCGPDSAFVTGQVIVVDGGISLGWQGSLSQRLAAGPAVRT